MQVTSPAAPVTGPAPAHAGKNAEASRAAFASLLQQSRSTQTAPEASAAEASAPSENEGADAPAAPFKPRLKLADKAPPARPAEHDPKRAEGQEPSDETAAGDPADAARAKRNEAPATDTTLAPWLAAAQPAPSALELAAARRHAGAEPADEPADTPVAADGVASAKAADVSALPEKASADTKARLETAAASQDALAAWSNNARADTAATQRMVQPLDETIGRVKPGAGDTITNTAALGAAVFNPLLGAARESAPPLTVNLPTPLASAEFAQALGVQMSVLASDGVQRAELQLNPAEMGPVSVQIVIDGASARVDFGADLAATRQVIEAGMPELAGALRDAGFTLAGGGVSQHSGRRNASPQNPGGTGHRDGVGDDAGNNVVRAVPQRRAVAAGGVDLYA